MISAGDWQLIFDRIRVYVRESVVEAASRGLPLPIKRPGTVAAAALPGASVTVRVDGDTNAIAAVNATGVTLLGGARVLVDFVPPHGIYVTGQLQPSGEYLVERWLFDGSASHDFAVPASARHLRLAVHGRSSAALYVLVRLNGDAGANYYVNTIETYYTSTPASSSANQSSATIGAATNESSRWADIEAHISGLQSGVYATVVALGGYLTSLLAGAFGARITTWDSTAAVTTLTLLTSGGNFTAAEGWAELWAQQ